MGLGFSSLFALSYSADLRVRGGLCGGKNLCHYARAPGCGEAHGGIIARVVQAAVAFPTAFRGS